MTDLYLPIKALHIVSVISWMAGLLYLPRLFIYHAENSKPGDDRDDIFRTMEHRLFRYIMNPAMMATWTFGLMLVFIPGVVDWTAPWPWLKGAGVLGMTWFHHWLGRCRRDFALGRNAKTGRRYRLVNEVPTVLMIVIVFSVVFASGFH